MCDNSNQNKAIDKLKIDLQRKIVQKFKILMSNSELSLLKDYISTLERENKSKSTEIQTITRENNQLIKECEQLRNRMNRSSVNTLSPNHSTSVISKLQSELKMTRLAFTEYKQQLERQIRSEGHSTVESFISSFKELEMANRDNTSKLRNYEGKIVDYEKKITLMSNELSIKKSQIQRLNDKITQNSNRESYQNSNYTQLQKDYEQKITNLSNQITVKKFQIQRLEEKISNLTQQNQRFRDQIISLQSNKSKYNVSNNAELVYLQEQVKRFSEEKSEWEKQRQLLQIKISDLDTALVEKNNLVAQLRLRQEYLEINDSTHHKDQQIQEQKRQISQLSRENTQLKRNLTYKDSTIRSLQTKLSSNEYNKSSQLKSVQRIVEEKNIQIDRILQKHNEKVSQLTLQLERYKNMSLSASENNNQMASVKEQNLFLRKEIHDNSQLVKQLQKEKQRLRNRINEYELEISRLKSSQYTRKDSSSDNQLRQIVRELKLELQEVKKSNTVIHEENAQMQKYFSELTESQLQPPQFGNDTSIMRYHSPQNNPQTYQQDNNQSQLRLQLENSHWPSSNNKSRHYHPPYFKSEVNLQKKKLRNEKSAMSPVRDAKSPSQGGGPGNKEKWESLQRKISALRLQNDSLKKTLLYN